VHFRRLPAKQGAHARLRARSSLLASVPPEFENSRALKLEQFRWLKQRCWAKEIEHDFK